MVESTKRKSKFWINFNILLFLIIISVLTILTVFIKSANIPNEVKQVTNLYLLARKESMSDALSYCYFKEENKETWTIILKNDNNKLLDYKIKKIKKINNNLFEISIFYNSSKLGEKIADNYVALIDNKYYFIINQRDIPDNIKGNYKPKIYGLEGEITLLS